MVWSAGLHGKSVHPSTYSTYVPPALSEALLYIGTWEGANHKSIRTAWISTRKTTSGSRNASPARTVRTVRNVVRIRMHSTPETHSMHVPCNPGGQDDIQLGRCAVVSFRLHIACTSVFEPGPGPTPPTRFVLHAIKLIPGFTLNPHSESWSASGDADTGALVQRQVQGSSNTFCLLWMRVSWRSLVPAAGAKVAGAGTPCVGHCECAPLYKEPSKVKQTRGWQGADISGQNSRYRPRLTHS
eukprot:365910-Chlamydomonas_euryale.AAC.21